MRTNSPGHAEEGDAWRAWIGIIIRGSAVRVRPLASLKGNALAVALLVFDGPCIGMPPYGLGRDRRPQSVADNDRGGDQVIDEAGVDLEQALVLGLIAEGVALGQ